jgi:hypothetical protein
MWDLLTGATMQRMVVYSTIGYILSTAEITWEDGRFWCVMILTVVLEQIYLLEMPKMKLMRLKDFMDRVNRGEDHSEEELRKLLKDDKDGTE